MIRRHMQHNRHQQKQQSLNLNTINSETVLHNIETQVSEHSLHGMIFAFIVGVLGNIQHPVSPTVFESIVKVAANTSILLGCIIALLTAAVKTKEFYTTFFKKDKAEPKRRTRKVN